MQPGGKFKGPNDGITVVWALFSVAVVIVGVNGPWVVLLPVPVPEVVGGWWMVDGGW